MMRLKRKVRTIFRLIGDVLVGDARCFERQADELSTSWDTGPVQQLIWRLGARFLGRRHGGNVVSKRSWTLSVVFGEL